MIDVLVRNRWLLALCGVLEAVCAAINFLMKDADGAVTLRTYTVRATAVLLGKFALGAGVCAIAAAVWSFGKGKWWLLALHGIALSLFGLIGVFWSRERLSFLPVALLLVVMAASIGVFELDAARSLWQRAADRWILVTAGAAAFCFALVFLVLGLRWVHLEQPQSLFLWLGAYFAFSAACMLGLATRLKGLQSPLDGVAGNALHAAL